MQFPGGGGEGCAKEVIRGIGEPDVRGSSVARWFATLTSARQHPRMSTAPVDLADILVQLFCGHGVDATRDGDWVILPKPYARAGAAVVREIPHPNAVVIQLDVRVFVGFGRMVLESFGGVGVTRQDAVADAISAFAAGSFHVILAAFFDRATDQVDVEEWPAAERTRRVILGPLQARGKSELVRDFLPRVAEKIRERFARLDIPDGTHWLRLYVAPDVREALLDNEEYSPAVSALQTIPWPTVDDFYSVRLFLVVRGGIDLADLAGQIYELRDRDDAGVVAELARRGASPAEAEAAAVVVPLAFGRALLHRIGVRVPDEVILASAAGGKDRTVRLADLTLARQAIRFAETAVTHGVVASDQVAALAMRSPEMQAVNNALHAGSRAENLVLSAPILTMSDAALALLLPRGDSASETATAVKPAGWWRRFWKR